MPTTTHGYPYPLGTDRVMDGDDVIAALAGKVNDQLGVMASGIATIPSLPVTTPTAIAITLPVGRFLAAPYISVISYGGTTGAYASTSYSVSGYSASGFQINAYRQVGGTSAQQLCWIAHQI